MLHQILRLEVRTRLILRPARMHDRQLPLAPRRLQRTQFRMQSKAFVELHRVLRQNSQPRSRSIIVIIRHRRHECQPICRPAQKDQQQRPPLVAISRDYCLGRSHRQSLQAGARLRAIPSAPRSPVQPSPCGCSPYPSVVIRGSKFMARHALAVLKRRRRQQQRQPRSRFVIRPALRLTRPAPQHRRHQAVVAAQPFA